MDAIVVVAIDVNGVMPAVQQAADAGIHVLAVDAILPEGPHRSQISVDNGGAGGDIGARFLEHVEAGMGGSAKIGIVGALNSFIQNLRQEGFETAIAANGIVEVASVADGRNIQNNALAAAENPMTGNPDMNAIYATGEPALVGAIAAVEAQGATDRVKVFENFLFFPPVLKAQDLIDEGAIGTPLSIRIKSNPGRSMTAWKVPEGATAWRQDREKSGGEPLIFDDGHHKFALAWHFMGNPSEVHAFIGSTTTASSEILDAQSMVSFRFPGNRVGNLEVVHAPELDNKTRHYP